MREALFDLIDVAGHGIKLFFRWHKIDHELNSKSFFKDIQHWRRLKAYFQSRLLIDMSLNFKMFSRRTYIKQETLMNSSSNNGTVMGIYQAA